MFKDFLVPVPILNLLKKKLLKVKIKKYQYKD